MLLLQSEQGKTSDPEIETDRHMFATGSVKKTIRVAAEKLRKTELLLKE